MRRSVSRRDYLKATAATAAAVTVVPAGLVRGSRANDKINVACVGVAHIGRVNRLWLRDGRPPRRGSGPESPPRRDEAGTNIVALCDVDGRYLAEAAREHPGASRWTDFRRMLVHQKDIDAVMVSTPDHTHAVISMMAIKLGKHVATEKPLTHSVYEARALAQAAKKHGVATQLDNEGHGSGQMRRLVELVRSGIIGEVSDVHIWSRLSYHPAPRPPARPAPEHLDWDLWLGPAPRRDYHDGLHPQRWRRWWDFGTSVLGDFGCHFFDAPYWALNLGHPTTVEAESEGSTRKACPR
jgi:predicted dehydrogenase